MSGDRSEWRLEVETAFFRAWVLGKEKAAEMKTKDADKPEFVGGIAGIYLECNLASFPGPERACQAYGLTGEQFKSDLERYNPIDRFRSR